MTNRVVLLMMDVDKHGQIDHVVAYGTEDLFLTSVLGSYDPGPFETLDGFTRWLWTILRPIPGHSRP